MPLYSWRCKTCESTVEVLRDLGDYEVPPTAEEDPQGSLCEDHQPERVLFATAVHRGPGWGKKGDML